MAKRKKGVRVKIDPPDLPSHLKDKSGHTPGEIFQAASHVVSLVSDGGFEFLSDICGEDYARRFLNHFPKHAFNL